MRIPMTALMAAVTISTLGCAGAPSREQEWMALDEFTRRWPTEELRDIPGPRPVLIFEKGAEIPIRFRRSVVGDLEFSEVAALTVKVNKTLYVNLENLTASDDKTNWSSMEEVLFPVKGVTFSLLGREGKSEIAIYLMGRE